MKENTAEQITVLEDLTDYWTDRAHSYSAQNLAEMNDWRRDAWRELILEHAPKKECLRILDVGTGPGFFAINLALAGHKVTAIDVTEHMIWHAKRNAESYGAEVDFQVQRGEFLPFEADSFDLIVSRNVIWNLEYPKEALAEWARVLAPGGRMVYFDANWYLYLYDEELRARREAAFADFCTRHSSYHTANNLSPKRIKGLEQTARLLPLSRKKRPEWDCEVLQALKMDILQIIADIGPGVQDPIEWERDAPIHTFMVCAQKGIAADTGKDIL